MKRLVLCEVKRTDRPTLVLGRVIIEDDVLNRLPFTRSEAQGRLLIAVVATQNETENSSIHRVVDSLLARLRRNKT